MTIATGARHSMAYVLESAYGQTPATPELKTLRQTSVNLALTKETIQSEEIRADRQIAHVSHGNKQIGGDIGFELSYGGFDDMLEAALCGSWAANALKVGITRRSFTFERHYSDIGQYARYTGVEIGGLSLSVAPNASVTGSFTTIGKALAMGNTPITGATYPAGTANAPFNSFSGNLKIDTVVSAVVTSIEMTLENGLEALFVIGSDETIRPAIGQSSLTGSISAYFEDRALIDRFINETSTALEFTLSGDGGSYVFKLPKIKFTSGSPPETSGAGPCILNMDFQALYDPASQTSLKIERVPAVARAAK